MAKKNRVMQYLKTEHSWEGPVLAILSILVIVLGVQLATDSRQIQWEWLSSYQLPITIVIISLGAIGFLIAAFPIFAPSLSEWSKMTKPTLAQYIEDLTSTFIFILFFVLFFWIVEILLTLLFTNVFGLAV